MKRSWHSWISHLLRTSKGRPVRTIRRTALQVEALEDRLVMSVLPAAPGYSLLPPAANPAISSTPVNTFGQPVTNTTPLNTAGQKVTNTTPVNTAGQQVANTTPVNAAGHPVGTTPVNAAGQKVTNTTPVNTNNHIVTAARVNTVALNTTGHPVPIVMCAGPKLQTPQNPFFSSPAAQTPLTPQQQTMLHNNGVGAVSTMGDLYHLGVTDWTPPADTTAPPAKSSNGDTKDAGKDAADSTTQPASGTAGPGSNVPYSAQAGGAGAAPDTSFPVYNLDPTASAGNSDVPAGQGDTTDQQRVLEQKVKLLNALSDPSMPLDMRQQIQSKLGIEPTATQVFVDGVQYDAIQWSIATKNGLVNLGLTVLGPAHDLEQIAAYQTGLSNSVTLVSPQAQAATNGTPMAQIVYDTTVSQGKMVVMTYLPVLGSAYMLTQTVQGAQTAISTGNYQDLGNASANVFAAIGIGVAGKVVSRALGPVNGTSAPKTASGNAQDNTTDSTPAQARPATAAAQAAYLQTLVQTLQQLKSFPGSK